MLRLLTATIFSLGVAAAAQPGVADASPHHARPLAEAGAGHCGGLRPSPTAFTQTLSPICCSHAMSCAEYLSTTTIVHGRGSNRT